MSAFARTYRAFLSAIEPVFVLTRWLTYALLVVCGLSILGMMGVTVVSVFMRNTGMGGLTGDLDLVESLALVAVATALPYTTAVKGHIAIEYFFHKLGPAGRIAVDTVTRLVAMALFGALAWGCFHQGVRLREAGRVSMTLEMPLFWRPMVLGACCIVVVLVILHNLLRPGKEMIKP